MGFKGILISDDISMKGLRGNLIYNAEREIKNMYVMQKSASEIQSTIKEFREKIIARVMDWREKLRKATPPVSIARPRMEHLRKKEAELRALRVG